MNAIIRAHVCTKETNERAQLNVFELDLQKFCARSLHSLYRSTDNSTPCDKEENSRDSTFFCKNAITSSDKDTVRDCLLRFTMQGYPLHKPLSILADNTYIVRNALTEGLTDEKQHTDSGHAEQTINSYAHEGKLGQRKHRDHTNTNSLRSHKSSTIANVRNNDRTPECHTRNLRGVIA